MRPDLLQHDPVAVPLDGGQVCEEAGAESAEAGADADAHDQLARLLTVPHAVLVQGDLFGELGLNKTTFVIFVSLNSWKLMIPLSIPRSSQWHCLP